MAPVGPVFGGTEVKKFYAYRVASVIAAVATVVVASGAGQKRG